MYNDALREGVQYKTYIRIYDAKEQLVYESPFFYEAQEQLENFIPETINEYSVSNEWLSFPSRTFYYSLKKGAELKAGYSNGFEWIF